MTLDTAIQATESSEEKEPDLRDQVLAAKEEVEARQAEPAEKAEKPEKEVTEKEAQPEEKQAEEKPEPEIKPPNSWSKEQKARWDDIPREAREYIARRETEMHKAITAQDDLKTAGKAIRELVQPYQDIFQEMPDVPPPALIKGYLDTERTLRRGTPEQKAALIGNVIKAYNLDLNLLNNAIQNNVPAQQYQPDPKLQSLEQRIAAFEAQQQAQIENQKLSVIQSFMADNGMDESGIDDAFLAEVMFTRGAHPDLSEREILDKAWDRHQWTNPDARAALIAKQAGGNAQRDTLARAKKASASVIGSPGGGSESDKPADSVEEELRRQFGRASGRL